MLHFKGCPRCKGELYMDRDGYGAYLNCLQCGFYRDLTKREIQGIRRGDARVAVLQRIQA